MKLTSLLLAFCFGFSISFAQNGKQFTAIDEKDTAKLHKHLLGWQSSGQRSPDYYISWFNYYIKKATTEVSHVPMNINEGQAKDSSGKTISTTKPMIVYDTVILKKGFKYIDSGISKYPSRLDMRLGKIFILSKVKEYEAMSTLAVETMDYGYTMGYKWLWDKDKPLENSKEFLLRAMHNYMSDLYSNGNNRLTPHVRWIGQSVLKYFPENVETLTDVAISYLLEGDFQNALNYLLQAEKLAPKDVIILINIAQAYNRQQDLTNAKIYYEKIIKVGSKEEVKWAEDNLKQLK